MVTNKCSGDRLFVAIVQPDPAAAVAVPGYEILKLSSSATILGDVAIYCLVAERLSFSCSTNDSID